MHEQVYFRVLLAFTIQKGYAMSPSSLSAF